MDDTLVLLVSTREVVAAQKADGRRAVFEPWRFVENECFNTSDREGLEQNADTATTTDNSINATLVIERNDFRIMDRF